MSTDPIPTRNGRVETRRDTTDRAFKVKWYASKRWKRFRLVVLGKRPMCDEPGCPNLASHVDHKTDDVTQWSWREEDYNCFCPGCHTRKTRKTAQ